MVYDPFTMFIKSVTRFDEANKKACGTTVKLRQSEAKVEEFELCRDYILKN